MHYIYLGLAVLLLVGAAVVAIYWQGLLGGFFFDDIPNIVQASALQINSLNIESLLAAVDSGHAGPIGRPLSLFTFSVNYFACGLQPYCFKLVNVFIHVINSLLVFGFVCLVAREGGRRHFQLSFGMLLLFTLLWALHPIQVTSVLYVVQRMTSLSSFFVLSGVLLHIYARQCGLNARALFLLFLSWMVAFPLALLSKESGVLMVAYIFCYEAVLRPGCRLHWDRFGRWYVGVVLGGLFVGGGLVFSRPVLITGGYVSRSFTFSERLITETRVVWQYVQLVFLPRLSDFALYHDDFLISKTLLTPPSGLLSFVGWIGVLAIIGWQRKKRPLLAFALAWFLAGHSLESTVFPLEIMHEHRNYLPSLILPLLGLWLFSTAQRYLHINNAVLSGLAGLVAYVAVLTYLRADMYGDDLRRTQVEVQFHPQSVRSNYDAGALLVNMYNAHPSEGLVPIAREFFNSANQIDESFKLGLLAQLQLECLVDKSTSQADVSELARRLSSGSVGVQERSTMSGIAAAMAAKTLCLNRTDFDRLFESFLSNPLANGYDKAKVLNAYGYYVWTQEGNAARALEVFDQAISFNDADVTNYFNKIQLLRWFGDRQGILEQLPNIENRRMSREETQQWKKLRDQLIEDKVLPW